VKKNLDLISNENLGWVLGQMSQTQILLWFLKKSKTKTKSGPSKQRLNFLTCWPHGSDLADLTKTNTDLVYADCN
jgi:hypothetical protein